MNTTTRNLTLFLAMLLTACIHEPWYRARYQAEHASFEAGRHCDPAVRAQFAPYYVNGHYIRGQLLGSNRTTRTEHSPYRVVISANSLDRTPGTLRIHSIRVTTQDGVSHPLDGLMPSPNQAGMPPTLPFITPLREGPLINACLPRGENRVHAISETYATSGNVLQLDPENGEAVNLEVDVEVEQGGSSERRVLHFRFQPDVQQGNFIPLTV